MKALKKTLKFRAVTLLTTLGLTYAFTGNPTTSIGLTAIQQATNTAVYYFFEKEEEAKRGKSDATILNEMRTEKPELFNELVGEKK